MVALMQNLLLDAKVRWLMQKCPTCPLAKVIRCMLVPPMNKGHERGVCCIATDRAGVGENEEGGTL